MIDIVNDNFKEIIGTLVSFGLVILTALFKKRIVDFVKYVKGKMGKGGELEATDAPPKSNHFFDVEEKNYRIKFGSELKTSANSNFRQELLDRLLYCRSNGFKNMILDFNDTKVVNENVATDVEYIALKVITENNIQLIITLGKRGTTLIDMYAKLQKTVENFNVSNVKVYIYDKRITDL